MKNFIICWKLIQNENLDKFKLFLNDYKEDISCLLNYKDSEGRNLFLISCYYLKFNIIKCLIVLYLDNHIDINNMDNSNFNAIDIIYFRSNFNFINKTTSNQINEIIKILIYNKISINHNNQNPLIWSLFNGNIQNSILLYENDNMLLLKYNQQKINPLHFGFSNTLKSEIFKNNLKFFDYVLQVEFPDFNINLKDIGNEEKILINYWFKNVKINNKILLDKDIKSKQLVYAHKLLMISLYNKRVDFAINLTKKFGLSPFFFIKNNSALFISAELNLIDYLKYLIDKSNNLVFTDNKSIDKEYIFKLTNSKNYNISHIACIFKSYDYINILNSNDINLLEYNKNGFLSIDYIKNSYIFDKINYKINKNYLNKLLNQYNMDAEINYHILVDSYYTYDYCIITYEDSEDINKSFIYKKLVDLNIIISNNINSSDNIDYIKIHCIKTIKDGKILFYILLDFHIDIINIYAEKLKLEILNLKKNKWELFKLKHKNYYEPLRYSFLHKIINKILSIDFDLDYYANNNIILDYFPLSNYRMEKYIESTLTNEVLYYIKNVINPLSHKINNSCNLVNLYYGSKIGFLFLFFLVYMSWLCNISILGIIIYIIQYNFKENKNLILYIYNVLISFMASLFLIKWLYVFKRMLVKWNLKSLIIKKVKNKNFCGYYGINSNKQKISKISKLNSNKRRMLTEIPILLIGILFVYCIYRINQSIYNYYINTEKYKNLNKFGKWIIKNIETMLFAGLNFVFYITYSFICQKLTIYWENHKYISTMDNSLWFKINIIKLMIYNINLIMFLFINYEIISDIILTFILSKTFLIFVKFVLKPYIIYLYYKYKNDKIIKNYLLDKRKNFKYTHNLDKIVDVNDKISEKALNLENDINLEYKISTNLIKIDSLEYNYILLDFIAQFGFLIFFSSISPLTSILIFIWNIFLINSILYFQINYIKRTNALDIKDFKNIRFILLFIILFGNFFLVLFNTFGYEPFKFFLTNSNILKIIGIKENSMSIIITIIIEHVFIIFTFIAFRNINSSKN